MRIATVFGNGCNVRRHTRVQPHRDFCRAGVASVTRSMGRFLVVCRGRDDTKARR